MIKFDTYTAKLPFVWAKGPSMKEAYKTAWQFYWPTGAILTTLAVPFSFLVSVGIGWFLLGTGIATTYSLLHTIIVALLVFGNLADANPSE